MLYLYINKGHQRTQEKDCADLGKGNTEHSHIEKTELTCQTNRQTFYYKIINNNHVDV